MDSTTDATVAAVAVTENKEKQDAQPPTSDHEARLESGPFQHALDNKPFSILIHNEKRAIILCAAACAFLSPVSGQIYFPALNQISTDLNVSYTLVNLTVTTYLILQGLAPAFVAGFSDTGGRRSAYIFCFVLYLVANLALALQNNYAALLVLRTLQSAGSSGTVSLAIAVVADMVTPQDRGIYISYMTIAPQAGPTLGPLIGGLLSQFLGWHAIFWFLLILSAVIFVPVLIFMPETCRKIVDDFSVPPPRLLRCWTNHIIETRYASRGGTIRPEQTSILAAKRGPIRFPNPWNTFKLIFTKQAGPMLIYVGLVFSGFYAIVAIIPSQFGIIYGFNDLQIALCYIPLGAGTCLAAIVRGRYIDSRYRHHAKRLNFPLAKNRNVNLAGFPIERARIETALPPLALGLVSMVGFGWTVQARTNLAGPLVFLFCLGFGLSATANAIQVLLVDMHPGSAGTATAAVNLTRCWLGAAATSFMVPLIDKIGNGWTATFLAGIIFLSSPVLLLVMRKGPGWRAEAAERKMKREAGHQASPQEKNGNQQ